MGVSLIWETVPIKTQIYAWYDYTITLIKREMNGPYLFELNLLHSRMLCAEFRWNLPSNSWFLKLSQCIFAIRLSCPLGKGCDPTFEQNWNLFIPAPFMRGCFVPNLGDNSLVVLEKQIFKFRQCVFNFAIIFPWKRAWPFIWTNLIQTDLHTSFFAISLFHATFDVTWHD